MRRYLKKSKESDFKTNPGKRFKSPNSSNLFTRFWFLFSEMVDDKKNKQLNALVAAVRKCSPWFLVSVGTGAFGRWVASRTVRRGGLATDL